MSREQDPEKRAHELAERLELQIQAEFPALADYVAAAEEIEGFFESVADAAREELDRMTEGL